MKRLDDLTAHLLFVATELTRTGPHTVHVRRAQVLIFPIGLGSGFFALDWLGRIGLKIWVRGEDKSALGFWRRSIPQHSHVERRVLLD